MHSVLSGKNVKRYYIVCGVQDDFTRAPVNNMPTHIYPRISKKDSPRFLIRSYSLLQLDIHHPFIAVEPEFTPALELVRRCPPVNIGSLRFDCGSGRCGSTGSGRAVYYQ
ncbi:hypothetical protein V565_128930 [Rhizoctonia solani 123E]|uniref:Uncharacterized protein n=1 Tax=Rhizoctonia solani 123E TaxID=1423351 RepID=A0A074RMJ2_9AGAM|nr:hypothetical protein V565_128930 [Rhizoctonia solani 123E]